MNHGIGIGVIWVDAEGLREAGAVGRLDRGEAETLRLVARRDEADPARAEHADAVVENHVVVGPGCHQRLSRVSKATSIKAIAGPVFTRAPSGSIQRSGVRISAPAM